MAFDIFNNIILMTSDDSQMTFHEFQWHNLGSFHLQMILDSNYNFDNLKLIFNVSFNVNVTLLMYNYFEWRFEKLQYILVILDY